MIPQPPLTFAQLLRHFRQRQLLSSAELARRASLSPPLISRLETGRRTRTTLPVVRKLCAALELEEADRRVLVDSLVLPALQQRRVDEELLRTARDAPLPPLSPDEAQYLHGCRQAARG